MITRSTVFILGAGASMPYGFPSGSLLVEQICAATAGINHEDDPTALIDKGQIHNIITARFGEVKTQEFGSTLYKSQKSSIDSFLEHRPEFLEIGKFAIALFILRKEIFENLILFQHRQKGCYQYLFNSLDMSWDKLAENKKVGFITFNYDRSLEHYLVTSLQNSHGKTDIECAEQVNNIPIIHVHGSLGKLPWQARDGIQYGASIEKNKDNLSYISAVAFSASKQIKVIAEDQSTSEEFQSAFRLISDAEHIYFLGFGYNSTNLERLQVSSLPRLLESGVHKYQLSPMKGTARDLQDAEKKMVQDRWHIHLPDTTSDSLMFLRKYTDLG